MIPYLARSGWYKLILPDGFVVDDRQAPISIYDPQKGGGAIQLSVFEVEQGDVNLKTEFENFLTSMLNISKETLPYSAIETLDNKRVVRVNRLEHENRCYLVRLVHQENKIALVTYNALCIDFPKEILKIEQIVDSLELLR